MQRSRAGFIAEASLDVRAYHCDALVTAHSSLVCLPIEAFKTALKKDSTFLQEWAAHLARKVRTLRAQCERLNLNTAAERIIHYIETQGSDGSVTLSQSRKAWASELGVSHEALYRTLRRLQLARILKLDRNNSFTRLRVL